MANTFSQIYIQTVFAVGARQSLIKPEFKSDLHKYIAGIVRNQGQKLISINGMPDHIHILIGLKPAMAFADLVREIKADSSNFVNERSSFMGNSVGRKDTAPSRMVTLNSTQSFDTFKIRSNITVEVHSELN